LLALFPESNVITWAFIGPIVGALGRPLGGWLSDHFGGAKVTFWNFAIMLAAAVAVLIFLPSESGGNEIHGFLVAFMLLFITTGIGNGSVFRLVPTVFLTLHEHRADEKDQAAREAEISAGEIEASVALGFTAAIAALGLFFIPAMVALSIETTGTPRIALMVFVIFYATCLFATWWWYRRDGAEVRCD